MDSIGQYLEDLKSKDPTTREKATGELWAFWHRQAGPEMERDLYEGTRLMDHRHLDEALKVFRNLIEKRPDFPEAHNKLATLLFLMGQYEESVKECEETLRMNPHHFGALNGMGMCLFQLHRFEEAIVSFKKALEIQPYAEINGVFIARCRGNLN
ncbi:MAG: tetratricopeptide repeat protein [Nitrospinota bacterium]|nr:tetratricopeptide repeat protein [Nitrospinota bacterium]